MRAPLSLLCIAAAALVTVGCTRKGLTGDENGAYGAGDGFGGAGDVVIDANDPLLGGIGDAAGAFGGRFEDTRERITDAGLETLYFTFDSYTLPPEELYKADAAVQYLLDNPTCVMIVEGHCDERGSNEYNLSLSEQRAIGVRDYMVALGVASERIQTRAFGEEKPADPAQNEAAYAKNRRAEFVPYK